MRVNHAVKAALVFLWVALWALVFAACGSSDDTSTSDTTPSTNSPTTAAVEVLDEASSQLAGEIILAEGAAFLDENSDGLQILFDQNSDGSVSFESQTPGQCSVDETGVVKPNARGKCEVQLVLAATETHSKAVATFIVEIVGRDEGSITLLAQTFNLVAGEPAMKIAYTVTGDGAVTFKTETPKICSVTTEGAIVPLTEGTCSIEVTLSETDTHTGDGEGLDARVAAPRDALAQEIAIGTLPGSAVVGDTGVVLIASSDRKLPIVLEAWDACTVNAASGVLTLRASGTCWVSASNTGTAEIKGDRTEKSFPVSRREPALRWVETADSMEETESRLIRAKTDSDGPVTYEATAPCTVDGRTVKADGPGECAVYARTPQTDQVHKGEISFTLTVSERVKKPNTLTWRGIQDIFIDGNTTVQVASSGPRVKLELVEGSPCTLGANGVLTPRSVGVCEVKASHPGDDEWIAVSESKKVAIHRYTPTVEIRSTFQGAKDWVRIDGSSYVFETAADSPRFDLRVLDSDQSIKILDNGTCSHWSDDPTSLSWQFETTSCEATIGFAGTPLWEPRSIDIRFLNKPSVLKWTMSTNAPAHACVLIGDKPTFASAKRTIDGYFVDFVATDSAGAIGFTSSHPNALELHDQLGQSYEQLDGQFRYGDHNALLNVDGQTLRFEVVSWAAGSYTVEMQPAFTPFVWKVAREPAQCLPGQTKIGDVPIAPTTTSSTTTTTEGQ